MPFPSANAKPAAAGAARPAAGRPAAAQQSRYAGIKAGPQRDPMPPVGQYRMRLIDAIEGYNPGKRRSSNKLKVAIDEIDGQVDGVKAGDVFTLVFLDTSAGASEGKRAVMGFLGFDDEDAFDEYAFGELNPATGERSRAGLGQSLIDAVYGTANEFTAELGGRPGIDRLAYVRVGKGNPCKDEAGNLTGDYYRTYAWTPAPEEEQTPSA